MKKLLALLCSLMIFSGAVVMQTNITPVQAQYTADELENAIAGAVKWARDNSNPLDNIGAEASDIAVTAFSRAGVGYDYGAYLDGLDSVAERYSDSDPISSMQRSLMAVIALGGDSGYFGGRDFAGDSTYYRNLSGEQDCIGALTALNAGNIEIPYESGVDREELIRNILSYQQENGSFGDVRTTAAAIIALSEDYNNVEYTVTYSDGRGDVQTTCENAINSAFAYLSSQQQDAGDFYSLEDTAMVSLAMDAVGVGQPDVRFVKNGNTVMDGILTYRDTDGGFSADYNGSDALATSYALCALVSNARVLQSKAKFFDFGSNDTITIAASNANLLATATPRAAATARPTTRPTATSRPVATTRPRATTRPSATTKPRTTTKPAASPAASTVPKITPSPTKRPDLVGPAQIVGPFPMMTTTPDIDMNGDSISRERGSAGVPIAIAIIALLAAAAAVLVYMAKKNMWIFKKSKKTEGTYHAKQHRRTEEHRHYEERRKFEDRRKYAQRGKYKGRR